MHRSPDGLLRGKKDSKAASASARRGAASPKCATSARLLAFPDGVRRGRVEARLEAGRSRGPRGAAALRVGLLIPLSGPAGIWGPSAHKCATLAVDEINGGGGVLGREIKLVLSDAGGAPAAVAAAARELVEDHGVEAVVGMHISAVRVAVARALKGRVPFVYTPLYEGGERSPGVFAVGETPDQQLKPAVSWLAERRRARRWYLIGNDYVWPRVSHEAAKQYILRCGGEVVGEEYVPLGSDEFAPSLTRIRAARPHAVLVSLVGGDGVAFHRHFAQDGMAGDFLRLCSALDENTLLGIGAENTENLFAASGYFAALPTRANQGFVERYQQSFGHLAPVLSALGQSCYEGFHFYAALAQRAASLDAMVLDAAAARFEYEGARGTVRMHDKQVVMANYLAEADGFGFRIIDHLS
jgi:urea transport system substrate-binding protein